MKENTNRIDSAREKYLSSFRPLTPEEEATIHKDLSSPEFSTFKNNTKEKLILPERYSNDTTYQKIQQRIDYTTQQYKRRYLFRHWATAASIALLLGIGGYFFYNLRNQSPRELLATTAYGEIREIVLPDSSVVVLNALSSLSYPKHFGKEKREVTLQGEGYFKIRKDHRRPFTVKAGAIGVEVLGTTFNIQSYSNEDKIETALVEGSVAIHFGNRQQRLRPGEIASYDKSTASLQVEKSDLSGITQWKLGIWAFEDCPLEDILRALERKENVRFTLKDPLLKTQIITARFVHQESVTEILDVLSRSINFTYDRQGNDIIIKSDH